MKKTHKKLLDLWRDYYRTYMYFCSHSTSNIGSISSTANHYSQHDVNCALEKFTKEVKSLSISYANKLQRFQAEDVDNQFTKFLNQLNVHEFEILQKIEELKSNSVFQAFFEPIFKKTQIQSWHKSLDKNLSIKEDKKKSFKL